MKMTSDSSEKDQEFIRSNQDNTLLSCIQIKNNFFDYVDPEAILWGDFDGIPFHAASSVEEDYVIVKLLKKEEGVPDNACMPAEQEYPNKTAFKGKTKGNSIGAGSPLSDMNVQRALLKLDPYTLDDFEIIPKKRLKFANGATIDGEHFKNAQEVCEYYIDKHIHACLVQTRLKKVHCVLGAGTTHRHAVQLPMQYKGNRVDKERPILLKEARQYVIDNYKTTVAPKGLEADEVVDAVAALAYDYARKTGTRIKVVKAAQDKDAHGKRGVLFDWTKNFNFKYPQCWLIKDYDEDAGHLQLVKGNVKGSGLKFFAYQLVIGDSADDYNPRKWLPEPFKSANEGYGDTAFLLEFEPLKNAKEVLEHVRDIYFEWFPYGVQYTAWDGTEIDEDTASYLQKHYKLAYMLEGKDDKSTVFTLFDRFGVDYSKLVGNNKFTAPQRVFRPAEDVFEGLATTIHGINHEIGTYKSLKKADLVAKMDNIKMIVEQAEDGLEEFYAMEQEEK